MTAVEELVELEMAGWDALSGTADAAREFYGEVLADEVVMLLPGGLVIDDRGEPKPRPVLASDWARGALFWQAVAGW